MALWADGDALSPDNLNNQTLSTLSSNGSVTFQGKLELNDTLDSASAISAGAATFTTGMFRAALELDGDLDHDGIRVGFYGTSPIAQQTSVTVSTAAIHAALVALGLITA